MLTPYKFTDYIVWCLLRILLYSVLLSFILFTYYDLPKYALEFKNDIIESAGLFNITIPKWLSNQLSHPIDFYQTFLLILFIITFLAVLGFKKFQVMAGVCQIIIALIKNNPLKPSKLKPGEPYNALNEVYPWIDTIIMSLFGIFMVINGFIDFKEEWLMDKKTGNEPEVILEEDYEEMQKHKKQD